MARSGVSAASGFPRPRDAQSRAGAGRGWRDARCRGGGGTRPPRRRALPVGAGTCVRRARRAEEEGPVEAGGAEGGGEEGPPHSAPSRAEGTRAAPPARPRPAVSGAPAGVHLVQSGTCPPRRAAGRPGGAGVTPVGFPFPAGGTWKALKMFPSRAPHALVANNRKYR